MDWRQIFSATPRQPQEQYRAAAPGNADVLGALEWALAQGPAVAAGQPRFTEPVGASADYRTGAPGNFWEQPRETQQAQVQPFVDFGLARLRGDRLVTPTEAFPVSPDEPSWVGSLKGAGNAVWNAPGNVVDLPNRTAGAINGKWPIVDDAAQNFLGPIVKSVGDFFTKSPNEIEAERAPFPAPPKAPGYDPTAPRGVDPRWIRGSQYSGGKLPPEYFAGTIGRESGGRADARNPNSSATGAGQFIESTWLSVMKKHGAEMGYGEVAAQITPDGKMKPGPMRDRVLALRKDPEMSLWATAKLASDNFDAVGRGIGRAPTPAEVDLAHYFGPAGASAFINAPANVPAAAIMMQIQPEAISANPKEFYDGNRPRTVGELRENVGRRFAQGAGQPSGSSGPSWSQQFAPPPNLQAFQQTPMPELPAMPERPTPQSVNLAPVEALIQQARPQQTLTPEQIAARQKSMRMRGIFEGLASGKGLIRGPLAGYFGAKDEGLAMEQALQQGAADGNADWARWAVSPTMRVEDQRAQNVNAEDETRYLNAGDAWKVATENADRRWRTGNANTASRVETANANATNRWKWQTNIAQENGLQNLGDGAVVVTQADPATGQVTRSVQDFSAWMPGMKKAGATAGAFGSAEMPAPIKAKLGTLAVAAQQGPDAVWMTLADEVADSPLADELLGGEAAKALRNQATVEARGDAKRVEGIFKAKVAQAIAQRANSDPRGFQQDLATMSSKGIVTATGIMQMAGEQ